MSGLQVVSLFAGVGGFERAFANLGVPTIVSVELDKAARGVLTDQFPETTLMTDVTEVTGDDIRAAGFDPRRGILTAGWPCQGNSVAGRRGGMDDPRSGLWRHVVRLLAETRPRWFFGENVPGLLSVNNGRDFGRVVDDLGQLGYGVAWRVLDAQHFGVPQRRRRVLIVGCLGDGAAPVQVLLEPEGSGGDSPSRRASGQVVAALTRSSLGVGGPDDNNAQAGHLIAETLRTHPRPGSNSNGAMVTVAHTLTGEGHDASEDGTGRGTPLVPMGFAWQAGGNNDASGAHVTDGTPTLPRSQTLAVNTATAVRRLTPLECERLQGYPDGWTATSWGKPQSDAPRYRQMGNSVAVPCIEWVARRLIQADSAQGVAA
jgi:DNA (cytosine-5)-methyltransferase 1